MPPLPRLAPLALLALTGTVAAQTQCLPETPLDPPGFVVPLDYFGGGRVAIQGDHVLVGAQYDDNGGIQNAGSGLLFDVASGAYLQHLFPGPGTVPRAECGTSVDVDGTLSVMGAPYITTDDNEYGTAWVHDVTTGAVVSELFPSEPGLGDRFGGSVALSGTTAVVGAPESTPGSLWVFDVTTGQQLHKLIADTPSPGDWLGWSLDMDGDLVIAGALRDSQAGQPLAGAAYVFDVSTGQQLLRLESPQPQNGGSFGREVAIDGDRGLVLGDGKVYLFDLDDGSLLRTFSSPGPVPFGGDIALDGDRVVIGYDRYGFAPGTVFVFSAATGALEFELHAPVPSTTDGFGLAVDIDGDRLAVTANKPLSTFVTEPGKAYLYDLGFDGFFDLGGALAGAAGAPLLTGSGALVPGGPFSLSLTGAAPSAAATLVLGLVNLSAPFKGGVLVPSPDVVVPGLLTDGGGAIPLPLVWPTSAVACLPVHVQYWIADAGGPAGYAASNGLGLMAD